MKIIKEIEKSRLTEDGMYGIKGGTGNGENCTDELLHRTCGSVGQILYEANPCILKITCPSSYVVCGTTSKNSCSENYSLCSTEALNACPNVYAD